MSTNSNAMLEKLRQYGKLDWCKPADVTTPYRARIRLYSQSRNVIAEEPLGKFVVSSKYNAETLNDFANGKNEARSINMTVQYPASVNGFAQPLIGKATLEVYRTDSDAAMDTIMVKYEANLLGRWTVEGIQSGVYRVELPENVFLVSADPF